MRDFLYDLQKDIPKEKIKSNCKNVLKALIIKFPDIGYCQGMNYIITFLLCFASEEETFDLFAFAVENILPPKFFQSNEKGDGLLGVLAEKHALSFFLHDFLENNDPDILYSANQILELKSVNWLLCLLINYLDFKSTYFLWDNMFRDSSIIEIDKAILLIVANQINYLSDPNYDSNLLNDSIVRNITLDLLKKNAKNSLDPVLKKKYFDEFIKNISEKWRKQEPIIFHQLEKITHFSKDEIKEIQNEFIKYLEENYKSDKKSEVIGIYKSDFVKIMTAIQENKLLQDKAFFKLNPSNLDRIFEIFDSDKSGSLDFKYLKKKNLKKFCKFSKNFITKIIREFLCCISLFMRGQIKEKMELCFWLFDHDHKGFLNSEEIDSFLCTLFKAIMISYTKEEANLYSIQFSDFKKRIFKEYCTNGTMNFTDLNEIIKDPFIFELSSHYRGLIRKNTSTQVAATINQNILFSIDENQKK